MSDFQDQEASLPMLEGLVGPGAGMSALRDSIVQLERVMLTMPQLDVPILHHFAPGVYMREMRAPAGATITGKIHKTEHLNILAAGDITVATDTGMKRLQAPCVILSRPGTKRAAYCHSDVCWITVHATDETDIPTLEAMLVTDSFDDPALAALAAGRLEIEGN